MVEAPAQLRPWVAKRYGRLLRTCAAAVLGPGTNVHLVVASAAHGQVHTPRSRPDASGPANAFNPRHTFDQFVIGDSNRLAHAAALAIAEMPGLAYNPLFICGPPGLGKTHLLHSIANYVTAYGAGATVRYTTAEAFTNHFVGALRTKGVDAFKAAYRGVDVLLVDDVQFLQEKVQTEQEFFHTFNALHQAGAQIVLTSDRLPRDLGALELRLRERFEAGLVTDVRAPDPATRLTILRKRVQQDDVGTIDPAALELIADRVTDNVRALEGALVRVVAFGSLTGRPVTAELAGEVLAGLYPELHKRVRAMTVTEIQERTAEAFGISVDAMLSSQPHRRSHVAAPSRDVPRTRAHGAIAARDRARLRRAQPHDRHACLPAHRRTDRGGPPGLRAGPPSHGDPQRRTPRVVTPPRLTDCPARVHTRRTASDPQLAGSPAVLHTIHTP